MDRRPSLLQTSFRQGVHVRDRSKRAAWIGKQEIMELILWLIAAYAMICVAVYFGNRLYMYFPDPTRTLLRRQA